MDLKSGLNIQICQHDCTVKQTICFDFIDSSRFSGCPHEQRNHWLGGWVHDLRFYVFSTVFQSYQDYGRVILKSCVPWNHVYEWKGLHLERGLNPSIGQGLTYWATRASRHWLNWADAQTDLATLRSNMPVFSNDAPHFRLVCIGRSIDWFESRLLDFVSVVALLFYVDGKHLRTCRDGQLT